MVLNAIVWNSKGICVVLHIDEKHCGTGAGNGTGASRCSPCSENLHFSGKMLQCGMQKNTSQVVFSSRILIEYVEMTMS